MPSMEVRFMMSLRHWKASHEILLCCSLYGKTSFTWNTLVLFFIWQDKLHMKYPSVVLYMARQASHEIPFCCSLYGKRKDTVKKHNVLWLTHLTCLLVSEEQTSTWVYLYQAVEGGRTYMNSYSCSLFHIYTAEI